MIRLSLLGLLLVGCAESFSPPSDAPIELDPERLEVDLGDEEYAAFCDYFQRRAGYPDDHVFCPDPGLGVGITSPYGCARRRVPPATIPGCRLTIGDWLRCAEASEPYWCPPARPECRRPPECGWFTDGTSVIGPT